MRPQDALNGLQRCFLVLDLHEALIDDPQPLAPPELAIRKPERLELQRRRVPRRLVQLPLFKRAEPSYSYFRLPELLREGEPPGADRPPEVVRRAEDRSRERRLERGA